MELIEIEKIELLAGKHSKPEDGMCVMEAVSIAAGEPFNDCPICTDRVISRFAQKLNDRMPAALRNELLKPLIFKMIGTAGDRKLSIKRMFIAADFAVRVAAPLALDALGYKEQAATLRSLSPLTNKATAEAGKIACRAAAAYAAYAAAYAAADAYAADAADAAAYAAYAAAADAYAADAYDAYAAYAAADAYAADAAAYAAYAAAAAADAYAAKGKVWKLAADCLVKMIEAK